MSISGTIPDPSLTHKSHSTIRPPTTQCFTGDLEQVGVWRCLWGHPGGVVRTPPKILLPCTMSGTRFLGLFYPSGVVQTTHTDQNLLPSKPPTSRCLLLGLDFILRPFERMSSTVNSNHGGMEDLRDWERDLGTWDFRPDKDRHVPETPRRPPFWSEGLVGRDFVVTRVGGTGQVLYE